MRFGRPAAIAQICGDRENPDLKGIVTFIPQYDSVLVVADISGLPASQTGFYGFHIHEGSVCSGDFSGAGSHSAICPPNPEPPPEYPMLCRKGCP